MLRTSDQFAYLSESEWALLARYVYKYEEFIYHQLYSLFYEVRQNYLYNPNFSFQTIIALKNILM